MPSSIHTGFDYRQNGGRQNNTDHSLYYAGTEVLRFNNTSFSVLVPLDMGGFDIDNAGFLILNAATAPVGTEVYAVNDNTGDLTLTAVEADPENGIEAVEYVPAVDAVEGVAEVPAIYVKKGPAPAWLKTRLEAKGLYRAGR